MIKRIDQWLDQITMYRLILYYLIALVIAAGALGSFNLVPINPLLLITGTIILITCCTASNLVFSKVFKAPTNVESAFITALILALIIPPEWSFEGIFFLIWASVLAMGSKYILSINKKHLFNPAALAVAITSPLINQDASWWVGTAWMAPFVLIGGLLVVRKIRRFDMVASFLITSLLVLFAVDALRGSSLIWAARNALLDSALLFMGFVMLTEPLTTPPTKGLRITYGALVGVLYTPVFSLGPIFITPELALLVGNAYAYLGSSKTKFTLTLKKKIPVAANTFEFVFTADKKVNFKPGQYLECTLPITRPDSRGNRRYFTIASSPTETDIRFGIKFPKSCSSFKQELDKLENGQTIMASHLSGDFIMPENPNKKLAFIAGGIGITPFRSMIQYLNDKNEKRDIRLIYSCLHPSDFCYLEVLEKAKNQMGLQITCIATENDKTTNWIGKTGLIDARLIQETIPDYNDRTFYLSGPHAMVVHFEETLQSMGIKSQNIKADYFPGFGKG